MSPEESPEEILENGAPLARDASALDDAPTSPQTPTGPPGAQGLAEIVKTRERLAEINGHRLFQGIS